MKNRFRNGTGLIFSHCFREIARYRDPVLSLANLRQALEARSAQSARGASDQVGREQVQCEDVRFRARIAREDRHCEDLQYVTRWLP